MAWYRRSKLAFETLIRFSPKIVPKTPSTPLPISRIIQSPTPISNKIRNFGFSPAVSKKLGFQSVRSKQNRYNVLLGRRNYYVDANQVRHFGSRGPRKWFQNPRNVFIVTVVGCGFVITVYFGNLETIPYTKRTHFVLLSSELDKQIGDTQFKNIKEQYKGRIMPAIHPDSIRVRLIAKNIIEALQRGLNKEQVGTDLGYTSENVGSKEGGGHGALVALSETSEAQWSQEDEILDDKWVQKSRKMGKELGKPSSTAHLKGIKWEVVVVDMPVVNAFCLPGGKIVVFTGLLNHFRSDAEIATIIGHEVAHVVARHAAEGITKNMWVAIIQLILYQFFMPDVVNSMSSLFLKLPFSRRMEMEADYIGLLLLASAGYDPRVAPKVYEKLDKVTGGDLPMRDYLSTHPSGKKRAKLLANAKVMEEAMAIYREASMGRGIEGFL